MAQNVDKTLPEVFVTVGGKSRRVVFTLNALRHIFRATGWNIIDGETRHIPTPDDVVALLWAGLLIDDPALTMDDVGNMVTLQEVPQLLEVLMQGLGVASPPSDETAKKKAPGMVKS